MHIKRRPLPIPSRRLRIFFPVQRSLTPATMLPLIFRDAVAYVILTDNRTPLVPRSMPSTASNTGRTMKHDPELRPVDRVERPVRPALVRGWKGRCPSCGAGPMFRGYLKVRDTCPVCGEALMHHRADDGPAYLTILIVGHLMAPLLLFAFVRWRPDPWTLASVFSIGTVGLSLYLLPRLKGALIGLQWAKEMHGFGVGHGD
jgi:uncharacterized protein (DUF983 family)